MMRLWSCLALGVLVVLRAAGQQGDSAAERAFDFADACFIRGEYELAADAYRKYLDQFPTGPHRADAAYRLGEAEYQRRRADDAARAFRLYLDLEPEGELRGRAWFRLGELSHRAERYAEAVEPLERAAATAGEPAIVEAALYYLGDARLRQRQLDQARAALERCIAQTESRVYYVLAVIALIDLALERQDTAAAARLLAEAAKLPPANTAPPAPMQLSDRHLLRLAIQAVKAGETQAAVRLYERVAAEFPQSEFLAEAALGVVTTLFNAGKYAETVQRGTPLLPRLEGSPNLAEARYLIGAAHYELGAYAEAERYLHQALAAGGADAELARRARYRLVWCAHRQEDWNSVLEQGEAFLRGAPTEENNAEILYLMGQAAMRLERHEAAARHFGAVLALPSEAAYRADAQLQQGWCLLAAGQYDAAVGALNDFLAAHGGHPQAAKARRYLAEAAAAKGDYAVAIEAYTQAIQQATADRLDAELPELYVNLASCYYQLEDYAALAEAYRSLLRIAPEHPRKSEAIYWIGYQLQREGKPAEARERFREVIAAPGELAAEQLDDAYLRLAACAYQLDDATEAIDTTLALLRREVKLPPPAEFLLWVAGSLLDAKRHQDAELVYARLAALRAEPAVRARALVERGHCLLALENYDLALTVFDEFFRSADEPAYRQRAHLGHGLALAALGRCREALAALEQVDATGDDPEALARADLTRARCFEAEGDWDAAYAGYLRVWALYDMIPESPEAAAGGIRAASAAGQTQRAEQLRGELLQRYPDSPQARAVAAGTL